MDGAHHIALMMGWEGQWGRLLWSSEWYSSSREKGPQTQSHSLFPPSRNTHAHTLTPTHLLHTIYACRRGRHPPLPSQSLFAWVSPRTMSSSWCVCIVCISAASVFERASFVLALRENVQGGPVLHLSDGPTLSTTIHPSRAVLPCWALPSAW